MDFNCFEARKATKQIIIFPYPPPMSKVSHACRAQIKPKFTANASLPPPNVSLSSLPIIPLSSYLPDHDELRFSVLILNV